MFVDKETLIFEKNNYDRKSKYYRNKFIRNGIAGNAISGFLIYNAITAAKTFSLILIILMLQNNNTTANRNR